MRKTITALLLAAALPTVAMAMPGDDHRGQRHDRGPHAELSLSKEQRQEMKKIHGDSIKSRHEITQRYLDKLPEADKKAMKAEQEKSKTDHDKAIRNLLTPEQQKNFDAQQKAHAERRAEKAEFKAWKAEKEQKAN